MKKYIKSADDIEEITLDDKIDECKDNFDYITSGIEYLDRSGKTDIAESIVDRLNNVLQEVIDATSGEISSEE